MPEGSLASRRIVLTRAEGENEPLRALLEERGAEALEVPVLRFELRERLDAWHEALADRRAVTWVALTSPRAVRYFDELTRRTGAPADVWAHASIAALGDATGAALELAGLTPRLVGAHGTGAALARQLVEEASVGPGDRVLLPQSSIARPELADLLRAAGAVVIPAPVYDTRPTGRDTGADFADRVTRGERIDAVVLASPSAARAFGEVVGDDAVTTLRARGAKFVSIGPTTSAALRAEGLPSSAEAETPSAAGIADALERLFSASDD